MGLSVNGKKVDAKPASDGYVHLERTWQVGDVVALDLPMKVRRVYTHEKVEGNRGKVALMRGPIVYCLEAVDHPAADVVGLALPVDADLRSEHCPELLGGLTVLRGLALTKDQQPTQLTAVPYYA